MNWKWSHKVSDPVPTALRRSLNRLVSGHGFSRAANLHIFVIPSGLQPARDLRFGLFFADSEAG
jgi:hypothetical protein